MRNTYLWFTAFNVVTTFIWLFFARQINDLTPNKLGDLVGFYIIFGHPVILALWSFVTTQKIVQRITNTKQGFIFYLLVSVGTLLTTTLLTISYISILSHLSF